MSLLSEAARGRPYPLAEPALTQRRRLRDARRLASSRKGDEAVKPTQSDLTVRFHGFLLLTMLAAEVSFFWHFGGF